MHYHEKEILAQYDFANMTDFEDVLSKVNDDFPTDDMCGHLFDFEMTFTVFKEYLTDGSSCLTVQITRKD